MAATIYAECAPNEPPESCVNQWRRWEKTIITGPAWDYLNPKLNPSRDLLLTATFTRSGDPITYTGRAFWYGLDDHDNLSGHVFKIRGAFPPGAWTWTLTCSRRRNSQGGNDYLSSTPDCSADPSLNTGGNFRVEPSESGGVLYNSGLLRVAKPQSPSPRRRALVFDDNTPFFWLGDAVWNANVTMSRADWTNLLNARADAEPNKESYKRFSVLQMGFAPYFALQKKPAALKPFVYLANRAGCFSTAPAQPDKAIGKCYRFNPLFWKELDTKVQDANDRDVVVVLASFIDPISDKADVIKATAPEAKIFAEAVTARMLGNFVIFSPGFDHKPKVAAISTSIETVGSGIRTADFFIRGAEQRSLHPLTNHPAGSTPFADYRTNVHNRSWLDFELFQSGTPQKKVQTTTSCDALSNTDGLVADELRNITERAVCLAENLFKETPLMPAINGESVYPGIESQYPDPAHPRQKIKSTENHTSYRARQTAYYSMLSGAQGYSMGVCGVFDWGLTASDGCPDSWNLQSPGVQQLTTSMRELRSLFQTLPGSWLRLMPQPGRIRNPESDPTKKMVLAYDGRSAVVAYVPNQVPAIKISFDGIQGLDGATQFKEPWVATWVNPRTGETSFTQPPDTSEPGIFLFTKPVTGSDPISSTCERYDQTAPVTPCRDWVLRITGSGRSRLASGTVIQVINGPKPPLTGTWVTAQITPTAGQVTEKTLNTKNLSSPGTPRIVTDSHGNSMVVWQAGIGTTAQILARRIDSQGNLSSEFVLAEGKAASPGHPTVAALPNDDFVVAWAGTDPTDPGPWIRTSRYDHNTQAFSPAGIAVACNFVAGDNPLVAAAGSSGYVLAWEMTDGNGIYVLKVDGADKSDAKLATGPSGLGSGLVAVLENLQVSGAVAVRYRLYSGDAATSSVNTETASLQTQVCPTPVLAAADQFSTVAATPRTISLPEFLRNDAPGAAFDHADPKCVMTTDGLGCTYTPAAGFTGTDTFNYTVRDAAGHTGSALVTMTVQPALVANPDNFTVQGNSELHVTSAQLLANDSPGALFVTVQNPLNGGVQCDMNNPANCVFTPDPGFSGTARFEYLISRDGNPPFAIGIVSITVTAPPPFTIAKRCTDGVCVFTALASNSDAALNYVWHFGDGSPELVSVYKVNHRFMASGTYTVSVTVIYDGLPLQQSSLDVVIDYAPAAEWTTQLHGLFVKLHEFDLSMFPDGTAPAINWSPTPEDCDPPANGCGSIFIGSDTSCLGQDCSVSGTYSHSGVFDATLRIMNAGQIRKEYPVAIEAVNQVPAPSFTVSRPDPNVRDFVFTNVSGGDDGPYPLTFEWDFGDGTTDSGQEDKVHSYSDLGTYTATLTVTDGDELTGVFEKEIVVTNAPPVPRITVNCKVLDCDLAGDLSTDDGSNITTWNWDFGDGQVGSGDFVTHHYAAAGCYTVTLTVIDGDLGSASTTQKVVAGPPLVATNTGVVVDAHVQSYPVGDDWNTTNGNLNGILEPGETVVVEPTWPIAPSTQQLPVSAAGSYPWGNQYGFRDTAPWYDISAGVSDCWSLGHCYAVFVLPQFAQGRPVHADIQFDETNLSTGQPTPGSPVKIHVGKSFSDVEKPDWSYAEIESVLHFGVDSGCGGTQFCPGAPVSRGEVARWLMKAEHGGSYQPPACTAAPFTDVPCSHPYAAWIAQLKAEGLTSGVGGGNYAPDQALTRAEAAVFLLRTKMGPAYVPPACSPDFGDVACTTGTPHWAAAWISDVKARGISKGCDLTAFCPNDAVDRAQAAALVAKTFGLRIDKVQCPIVTNNGFDLVPTHVDLPPIVNITFFPDPAVVGGPSTATMTIGDPPAVAADVSLSIDNPAASVPPSVTVPALGTSATFPVTPANITVRTTTHITATYLGQTKTVALDICTQPPSITAHPTSRIIDNGDSTMLSVTATGGGGPLSYQWYEGITGDITKPVPGGTNSTVTVTPMVTTGYWVRVSATCGIRDSNTAVVTVCNPPKIPGPPLDDVVVIGNTDTLTVTATGSDLSYQWYEGTSGDTTMPIKGETNPAYTTVPINVPHSYWVRVTSTCNGIRTKDSPTATVTPVTQITRRQIAANTVNSLTSITTNWTRPTQPGSLLVAVMSSSHVAAVGAFGAPSGWQQAVSYEWNHLKTTIYYYPNNPGGRTAETITTASFRESVLQLIEYVGATASPLDVTAFDGDNTPRSGIVSTGTTQWMTQPKAVVISALSTNALTSFTSPSNSFVRLDEHSVDQLLTAAVHERMVSAVANYGHSASVGSTGEWLGMVAVFKSIDGCTTAPAITAQPASTTVSGGSPATLSVTATGGSLQYQWYQGTAPSTTTPVPGGNGATLTVTPSATTSYWVRVFNACGAANSNTATVNVCASLGIAAQPLSQSVTSGFSATLSVTPSGSGPFSYQWYEGASPTATTPVGTDSPAFTTPALTANKSYWVRVTSTCNGSTSVNSNTAVLTVSAANQIARRQLAASTANSQTSITTNWTQPTQAGSLLVAVLSAQHGAAVGNFTPPAGWQLATSYEMANVKSAIYYYPNHPGGRTSETFGVAGFRELVLQLIEYTGATTAPLDKVVFNGDMAVNGGVVSTGTTAATSQAKEAVVTALTIMAPAMFTAPTNGFAKLDEHSVLTMITSAVHERIVSTAGAYGHDASVNANTQWVGLVATFKSLDLCSAAPSITTQPASSNVSSGGTATLSVTATTSGGTLSYQWYEGASGTTTTPVGTNSASFTTPPLSATKSYWVRVSNACGSVNSNTATVTVCNATGITTQPASQTINSGATATLSVVASGSGPFSYQWYEGASGVTTTPVGTNSASFTTPALTVTKSYWVRVTGSCGIANSNAATVTVCAPPGIATQPASQTIGSGSTATLSVVASGTGPFSYQWYEGASGTTTTPVGTNSASFTTPALTTTKSYWVRVTGGCGTANSNTATITIAPALARRQFAASTANSQMTITTNWTQPTQAGTLLVAIVSAERSFYPIANWQPPAGWQLAVSYEMTNVKTSIYYYPNNPGGRTSETFADGGYFDDMILQLAEYTGVVTASPLDKTAFNGNQSNSGSVDTGYTAQTSQAKELVITALTSHSVTDFSSPSSGFLEIDDRNQGFGNLTTAVHEKLVTTAGSWGHSAQAGNTTQWVGVVATFKGQ
jgi:PKD repeat protein